MNEQLERLSKMVESREPIPFRDFGKLRRVLSQWKNNAYLKRAQNRSRMQGRGFGWRSGLWAIGNGAYDLDWELRYDGHPVVWYTDEGEIACAMSDYTGWDKLLSVLKSVFERRDFSAMEKEITGEWVRDRNGNLVSASDEDEPVGEAKMVEEDEDYASMVGADQLAKQFGLSDGQTKLLTKMFNKVAGAALKGGVGGLRNRLMGRGGDDEEVIDVTPKQVDVNTDVLHGALAMDAPVDMNTPCVAKLARMDGSAYYVFNWDGDDTIKAYYVDGEGNNGMITASYKDALVDGYESISYKETLGEIKDNEDF